MTFKVVKPKTREHDRGVEWSCGITFNGVVIATVFQAGRGGCDEYTWVDRSYMMAFADAAEAFNKAKGDEFWQEKISSYTNEPSADFCAMFIEDLMQEAEYEKRLATHCKKMVCIRMPGQSNREHSFIKGVIPTPNTIAAVKAKWPEAIILNPGYGETK